jgi:hypothetical protein
LNGAGKAEAFNHVVPMLVSAQPSFPGSRILPGNYYDVPIAIRYPKMPFGRRREMSAQICGGCEGLRPARDAIERMGAKAQGVAVAP